MSNRNFEVERYCQRAADRDPGGAPDHLAFGIGRLEENFTGLQILKLSLSCDGGFRDAGLIFYCLQDRGEVIQQRIAVRDFLDRYCEFRRVWTIEDELRLFLFPVGWDAKDEVFVGINLARKVRLRQLIVFPFGVTSL